MRTTLTKCEKISEINLHLDVTKIFYDLQKELKIYLNMVGYFFSICWLYFFNYKKFILFLALNNQFNTLFKKLFDKIDFKYPNYSAQCDKEAIKSLLKSILSDTEKNTDFNKKIIKWFLEQDSKKLDNLANICFCIFETMVIKAPQLKPKVFIKSNSNLLLEVFKCETKFFELIVTNKRNINLFCEYDSISGLTKTPILSQILKNEILKLMSKFKIKMDNENLLYQKLKSLYKILMMPIYPHRDRIAPINITGYEILKTPDGFPGLLCRANDGISYVLRTNKETEQMLAALISSKIGAMISDHIEPLELLFSREGYPFLKQKYYPSIKSIFEISTLITKRMAKKEQAAFKAYLSNHPNLVAQLNTILATCFLLGDDDVHLGNILLTNNHAVKCDIKWGLHNFAQPSKSIAFLKEREPLEPHLRLSHELTTEAEAVTDVKLNKYISFTQYSEYFSPSNALRDYEFLFFSNDFAFSLHFIAQRAKSRLNDIQELINKELTHTIDSLAHPIQKKTVMYAFMQWLGGKFDQQEFDTRRWQNDIVDVIMRSLNQRIHSMFLMSFAIEIRNMSKSTDTDNLAQLENLIMKVQTYLHVHGDSLLCDSQQKLLPREAKKIIIDALNLLMSAGSGLRFSQLNNALKNEYAENVRFFSRPTLFTQLKDEFLERIAKPF